MKQGSFGDSKGARSTFLASAVVAGRRGEGENLERESLQNILHYKTVPFFLFVGENFSFLK